MFKQLAVVIFQVVGLVIPKSFHLKITWICLTGQGLGFRKDCTTYPKKTLYRVKSHRLWLVSISYIYIIQIESFPWKQELQEFSLV